MFRHVDQSGDGYDDVAVLASERVFRKLDQSGDGYDDQAIFAISIMEQIGGARVGRMGDSWLWATKTKISFGPAPAGAWRAFGVRRARGRHARGTPRLRSKIHREDSAAG